MAKTYNTPGVYIEEKGAFPGSVVEVETAVPAFIGYTETAMRNGKTLLNKPVRITSLAEYIEVFGGAFKAKFIFLTPEPNEIRPVTSLNEEDYVIDYKEGSKAFMFPNIKLFYANGGGACYIVSVGTYEGKDKLEIDIDELLGTKKEANDEEGKAIEGGLKTLLKEQEPTMIVIPDAVNLGEACYTVYQEVLKHCSKMRSRLAIFDIQDGYQNIIRGNAEVDIITNFRDKIGSENLTYGAAYYPWLDTSIVQKKEVTFDNINLDLIGLSKLLVEDAAITLISDYLKDNENKEKNKQNLHVALVANSPTYTRIIDRIYTLLNLQPPSSAIAGIYTMVDNNRGVWKAPANVSIAEVIKPAVNITHDDQKDLNVDAISGKSINAIRTFPGSGTLVWGARTLDGNSLDWKYINVRRTMIMLEQSIKLALCSYVFEPNDTNTWVTVKSMIVNYLNEKWKQGALAGASPEDAFDVQIGLGNTMTAIDILEGKMLVLVKLAIVRPAEFIVVTFEQQMQKS